LPTSFTARRDGPEEKLNLDKVRSIQLSLGAMKFISHQIAYFYRNIRAKKNIRFVLQYLALLVLLLAVYSTLFHLIMAYEGHEYTWLTGLYWTLTVMSTLGFGDITFHTDLGRIFSIIVLLSGVVFLLILFPFVFLRFFYIPWMEAQAQARTKVELGEEFKGHVILTATDPISINLVQKLKQYLLPYVIVEPDPKKAVDLLDSGYHVLSGEVDDFETYRRARVQHAVMVVAMNEDALSTNIAFTVREISETVSIAANADQEDSLDILRLAGSNHVFQFTKMLGQSLARRVVGRGMHANVVGSFDELLIAELPAMRTPLEGKTLVESRVRATTGLTVVGLWERGRFELPRPDKPISPKAVLLLAGSKEQLMRFEDSLMGHYLPKGKEGPVLILGGGRVGQAAAETLKERGMDYRIVEKRPIPLEDGDKYIHGSAAALDVLEKAGIGETPSIIITTHTDDLNIYLTIYCRKLRPDVQIISRATLERNISTLHRAGADLVMSYASMGAATLLNLLKPGEFLMLAEGLNVFRLPAQTNLSGRCLMENRIREKSGCSVIAINREGRLIINPDPTIVLEPADDLILIGTSEAEESFLKTFAH
jgi:Trk K+ transport system NAD-binding subunit